MSASDAVPACSDEVCLTCSDAAVRAQVLELLADGMATVDAGAGPEQVSVALVDAGVGDVVVVHAGEAIGVLHD